MAKTVRRYTDLHVVLKSGASLQLHSDLGFVVEGKLIVEPEGANVLPFLDPASVAAIQSTTPAQRGSAAGKICPVPTCVAVIDGPWYACRDHWYDLPVQLRELVNVAEGVYKARPNPQTERQVEGARAKALDWWEKNPTTEGVAS